MLTSSASNSKSILEIQILIVFTARNLVSSHVTQLTTTVPRVTSELLTVKFCRLFSLLSFSQMFLQLQTPLNVFRLALKSVCWLLWGSAALYLTVLFFIFSCNCGLLQDRSQPSVCPSNLCPRWRKGRGGAGSGQGWRNGQGWLNHGGFLEQRWNWTKTAVRQEQQATQVENMTKYVMIGGVFLDLEG